MLKVTLFSAGFSGCAWWRVRNPIEALRRNKADIQADILPMGDNMNLYTIMESTRDADVVMLQSPGDPAAIKLIEFFKKEGKRVVLDYDDYSYDLSPYNPRYRELGTKEVQDKDGKWVWRDGFGGFDLQSNIRRYEAFVACCKAADCITVTTPYLASKFSMHTKTAILPNSIDLTKWVYHPKPEKYKDEIRVGWFGGDSHWKDIEEILPSLRIIHQKHPTVKLVIFAPKSLWRLFDEFKERIELHDWADLAIYPLCLSTLFLDIGLVPIEVNEFGRCKSNIKWLEFGALRIPSVMTNSIPYNTDVTDGVDGLLSKNEEFHVSLEKLILDKDLRTSIGYKAYEYVKANYDLDTNCFKWKELYESLVHEKVTI